MTNPDVGVYSETTIMWKKNIVLRFMLWSDESLVKKTGWNPALGFIHVSSVIKNKKRDTWLPCYDRWSANVCFKPPPSPKKVDVSNKVM